MEPRPEPTVQRRRLRAELRRARFSSGYTQREVADALGWSLSKVVRNENGQIGISNTDLRALLEHYGVKDPKTVNALQVLAADSRRQHAWTGYRDVLAPDFITYLNYESSASMVRETETLLVPGLLQTEEYARSVIASFASRDFRERDIDRQVEARLERQSLLNRHDPPEMFFILDEAVVRRRVGGERDTGRIMVNQLKHLEELAERPGISIQIVPFRSGLHFGIQGGFTILEFPDPDDEDLLFVENRRGPSLRDDSDEVARYRLEFYRLEEIAITPSRLGEFVADAIENMG